MIGILESILDVYFGTLRIVYVIISIRLYIFLLSRFRAIYFFHGYKSFPRVETASMHYIFQLLNKPFPHVEAASVPYIFTYFQVANVYVYENFVFYFLFYYHT